jgi:hypothetical protein
LVTVTNLEHFIMAVLSKHGAELYRYEGLSYKLSFRSDGQIMRDNGQGWKLWKRVKQGVSVEDYAARQQAKHAEMDRNKPAFAEFRSLLHDLVAFKARYWVVSAIELMPDDPDGCCTELSEGPMRYSDTAPELDLDDCVKLCRAYKAALLEANANVPATV